MIIKVTPNHAPFRAAYVKLREDLDNRTTDAACIHMAVRAVNAIVGTEGLYPVLLVSGALPSPARTNSTKTEIERERCVDAAMTEFDKWRAKRRINFGLKHTMVPKENEDRRYLQQLPAGKPILIFRTTSKSWYGPHTFVRTEGENIFVQTRRGRRLFHHPAYYLWGNQNGKRFMKLGMQMRSQVLLIP